jgi:Fur family ferric uptake transcriptional regulator
MANLGGGQSLVDTLIVPVCAVESGNSVTVDALYNLENGECLPTMPEKRVDDQLIGSDKLIDEARRILREQLARLGLKHSSQRDTILRIFFATRDHLSTEELHRLIGEHDPTIGYTTVYRALKLFTQCGLAAEVEFHDGVARYEHSLNRRNHHHMVCTVCGDSIEFFAPEVEEVEHRIGKQFRFATSRHTFQIYGTCKACQKSLKIASR